MHLIQSQVTSGWLWVWLFHLIRVVIEGGSDVRFVGWGSGAAGVAGADDYEVLSGVWLCIGDSEQDYGRSRVLGVYAVSVVRVCDASAVGYCFTEGGSSDVVRRG